MQVAALGDLAGLEQSGACPGGRTAAQRSFEMKV